MSERNTHSAIPTLLISLSSTSSFLFPPYHPYAVADRHLLHAREKRAKFQHAEKFLHFFMSNEFFHNARGISKVIGASRRIVASVLENSASSSPSFKSAMMRGLMPAFSNADSSFLSFYTSLL